MASVTISIDFGDPSGTLEEMGVEDCTNADEVIALLKSDGSSVAKALDSWDLLDSGTVHVTFTPDIPEELQMQSVFVHPEKPPEWTKERQEKFANLQLWIKENETHATWSDWDRHKTPTKDEE